MSGTDAGATTNGRRTVQDYIDEIPTWPDGTKFTSVPMTGMQWRIWGLAIAGKFFEGLVVFITGIALPLLFIGFVLFNYMTNLGPNAQTYLLAGEVFPTAIRGYGAEFAASFAKVGAVLTAFLFPILLKTIGTQALLVGLIIASLLGVMATCVWRVETRGGLKDKTERIQPQV